MWGKSSENTRSLPPRKSAVPSRIKRRSAGATDLGRNAGVDLIKKTIKINMILLKFRREKRIRQSFLLTNYCNFPRRILVTGGKHKASNRSDLPPFSHPAACSDGEVRGGGGNPPPRHAPTSGGGCSSERPQLPWLFCRFISEKWPFPFAERSDSPFSHRAPFAWQFYSPERTSQNVPFHGADVKRRE